LSEFQTIRVVVTGTGPIPAFDTDLHTPARPIAIASVAATQPLTQLIRIHLSIADQRLKVDAAQLSFDQRKQKLTDDVRHNKGCPGNSKESLGALGYEPTVTNDRTVSLEAYCVAPYLYYRAVRLLC
jgi:hypothetical protein